MDKKIKKRKSKLPNFLRGMSVLLLLVLSPLPFTSPGTPLAFAAGTGNHAVNMMIINKEADDKEITVKIGTRLRLELPFHGGAGYAWHMINLDPAYFALFGEETSFQPEKGKTGSPSTHIWRLKAIKEGISEISLKCYRDWEGIGKSADHFSVKIIINKHGIREN